MATRKEGSWRFGTVVGGSLVLVVLQTAGFAGDPEFCRQYAQSAITQFQRARAASCPDLRYPVWADDFQHHWDWCMKVTADEAQSGTRLREDLLRRCIGTDLDPNEVAVYEFRDFLGASRRFRLEPGRRHREVPLFSFHPIALGAGRERHPAEPIGSIRIGSGVGVYPYRESGFSSSLYDLCSERLEQDSSDLQTLLSDQCRPVRSLVIVRRGEQLAGVVVGVRASRSSGPFTDENAYTQVIKFLPEDAGLNARCHPLDNHGLTWIQAGSAADGYRVDLRLSLGIEGVIFSELDCAGESIAFPGPGGVQRGFNLAEYGWERRARSMLVRSTAGASAIATGTSTVYQPASPGLLGSQADATRRRAPESPDPIPNLSTSEERDRIVHLHWKDEHGEAAFEIDYVIDPSHRAPVFVGAWLYQGPSAFGGYTPQALSALGRGSVTVHLTLPPEPRRSDRVHIFFFEAGQQPFVERFFPLDYYWTR